MKIINGISFAVFFLLLSCDDVVFMAEGCTVLWVINFAIPILLDNLSEFVQDYQYGKENRHLAIARQRIIRSRKRGVKR